MKALSRNSTAGQDVPATLPRRHATRLRHYWRSHGWACHDNIDLDLLRWGLIEEIADGALASHFLVTALGRDALGEAVVRNRRARSRHAEVAESVARHLAGLGRLVFTELSIHTVEHTAEGRWSLCKPDVFSLTRSLRPDHLAPQVHEIKVRRSDLLGELRSQKTRRYRELAGEVFFVLAEGIAEPEEIPADYGVVVWRESGGYTLARSAPRHAYTIETRHWMAMARARPFMAEDDSLQLSF
ncbi:hypothetical protein SADO_12658 [Salinisphaera dokdonensis CL-ES53]|uniref:Uncharacterized protein n=1 Tax=Salinisphaera dokdonensis CL-ES53 TaxID=1304272 RepID=A0ABV2B380_9GAMM